MKIDKLKKYEKKIEPEITPEQHAEQLRAIADELFEIGRKLPPNNLPIPTTAELVKEFNDLVAGRDNRVFIIDRFDGKRVAVRNGLTEIISGGAEIFGQKIDTKNDSSGAEVTSFDKDQLELLRQIENA